jgi:hypothetical protein
MVNCLGYDTTNAAPACTNIVSSLYTAKPPTTSFASVNLSSSNAARPLLNCRIYYSRIVVHPQKSIKYIEENRRKK